MAAFRVCAKVQGNACADVATRLAWCSPSSSPAWLLQRAFPSRSFGSFTAPLERLEAARRSKPWPAWLRQEMRSNWAGETGAVAIYHGCQDALGWISCVEERSALEKFAAEHVEAEKAHLAAISNIVVASAERSWMPAATFGWQLGFLSTAIRGARGMYVTTQAVESFVEEHYGDQITRLENELAAGEHQPSADYLELLTLLRSACADEVDHKNDAAKHFATVRGFHSESDMSCKMTRFDRVHFMLVYWGSRVGAAIAKRI